MIVLKKLAEACSYSEISVSTGTAIYS
eukprot:SAG11_NODE_7314_length_1162_cov_1.760113_1_plen_26_part_10